MMERTIPQWMGRSWQGLKDLQVPPRGLSRFNPSWKFSPMEPIHHRHPWQEEEEKLKIRFWDKNSSVIETKYNIVIKIQINSKRNKWFLIQLLINAPLIPVSDQCLPVTPPVYILKITICTLEPPSGQSFPSLFVPLLAGRAWGVSPAWHKPQHQCFINIILTWNPKLSPAPASKIKRAQSQLTPG